MAKHTKIDLTQLVIEIRSMNYRRKLFKVLKRELKALGYWKDKPRGDPAKGYKMKGHKKNEQ